MNQVRRPLVLLAALLALAAPASAADAGGDPMRDSLRRVDAPWYDAKTDGWRRIELPKAREQKDEPDEDDGRSGAGIIGTVFTMLMYSLVAVAVGALIWFVARTWRSRSATSEEAAPTPVVNLSVLPFKLAVRQHGDPDSALAAALAAGDWALAAMWIYAIQLLRLDRTGAIRLVPGKTNRAYVREIQAAAPPLREALAGSVAVFERSFFGHQAVDEGELRDLQRRHAAFLAELAASEGRS